MDDSIVGINGYKERTFEEIKNEISTELNQLIPELNLLDNTLVSNLIDTSSVILKQQEGLIKYLFNGISYPSTSDIFFDLVSRDYGISRHPSAKSSCDIKITGTPGYIINGNTQFSNDSGSVVFYSVNNTVINSTGECIINCISDSLKEDINKILVGDINKTVVPDNNITKVENLNIPTSNREIENLNNFKERVQERVRNIVQGSPEGLMSQLKAISGVNPLLVNLNIGEQEIKSVRYNGIEAIVSGGDPNDIAKLLLDYCGLNSKVLVSNPSGSESNRTVEQTIKVGSSSIPVKFTRPKILNFSLTIKPKLKDIIVTNDQLKATMIDSIISKFNNLSIQNNINDTFIKQIFINELLNYGISYSNIVEVNFDYTIDGKPGVLDGSGYMTEKLPDTWLKITSFNVEIQS